jgi:hypothetical protein
MGDAPIQPSDLGLRTERNGKEGLVGGRISWSSYKDRMEATPTRWSIYLTDTIRPTPQGISLHTRACPHSQKLDNKRPVCATHAQPTPLLPQHHTAFLYYWGEYQLEFEFKKGPTLIGKSKKNGRSVPFGCVHLPGCVCLNLHSFTEKEM